MQKQRWDSDGSWFLSLPCTALQAIIDCLQGSNRAKLRETCKATRDLVNRSTKSLHFCPSNILTLPSLPVGRTSELAKHVPEDLPIRFPNASELHFVGWLFRYGRRQAALKVVV